MTRGTPKPAPGTPAPTGAKATTPSDVTSKPKRGVTPGANAGAKPKAKSGVKPTAKAETNASAKASAKAGAKAGATKGPAPFASTGYWLLKTEPESFSFDALLAAPRRRTGWDGVRNYQARNFLRDSMRVGDLVLVYHSNAEPPGVAGLARVASGPRPDPTQFDPADPHFDPDARREAPPWIEVEIEAVARAPRYVSLDELRGDARLGRMLLLQRGQRLSVQPVHEAEWRIVLERAGLDPDAHRAGG